MKRRIFRTMGLLILLVVFVFAVLWGLTFAGVFGSQVRAGLKTLRVSMINDTGDVVFDNMADPSTMENHLSRPEVADAVRNGAGESERFSDTLGETTYYYAARLANGAILRLALTTDSVAALIYKFMPTVMICLAAAAGFAFFIARRLTKRITAPINGIDLDKPIWDGSYEELLPFFSKIEKQKRELSEQLAQIESRTATITAITGNMKEGLLLLDEEGRVQLANESVLMILGTQEAVGKSMIEICRDADFLERARTCLAGEKAETVLRRNGRFYSVFFSPVLDKALINGAVVLFIDITERYAAEAQRKEFSANVSHELKTPLTTIAALSEMIVDGTAKERDTQPFVRKIRNQTKRLIDIIDDIIKLSEFDEGGASKHFSQFNLYDVASAVISGLREKAAERNVAVELRGPSPLMISANTRMMDELLYNLVDNAIKYNRDGGDVTVLLSADQAHVVIAVEDSGIGIPQDHIGRIFERFYRVDKSRSKKTGGTGLGLSIVKHIAEFHGGYVAVESEEGVGTKISALFPRQNGTEYLSPT